MPSPEVSKRREFFFLPSRRATISAQPFDLSPLSLFKEASLRAASSASPTWLLQEFEARLGVKFGLFKNIIVVVYAYGYRGNTLAGTTRPLGLISVLAEQEILRLLELYRACETPVTAETLSQFLNQFVTGRIISVRSCASFLNKAGRLLGSLKELPVGPSQTTRYYAALYTWVFDTYEVAELSVARIRKVLAQYPVPDLPLNRLGVKGGPPKSMWTRDIKMGRLFVMLHIVRTVVLRCLWMHRNDIRFHELSVDLIDVQAQVKAVVTLHVERYYQDLLLKTLNHSGFQRRHLRDLVGSHGLTLVLPAETDTEDPN
ncbi:uncharacterized protein PITG_17967 [Phytophthora infestans T30-4]|uniref:Uncharacterized protein n=1 Tax=Phytophthora infestans (strain T30-4) TaxID=403677 RepID=D0NXD9_PHYIT|nr:uncharacterized protein PITG_17967 [Phytophthora infestans T30-4]EEY67736.1 conserved hypothetical protein [Phytophthora infestans T30-4]|eukprot:XP_002896289.1 conserved hypothetical protein [Phytophthora infestans T30-4]